MDSTERSIDRSAIAIEHEMTVLELIDHLEATHHVYVKQAIPEIRELIGKIADHHGEERPALIKARQTFLELADDLIPHLNKEEQVLFPALRQMSDGGPMTDTCFGTVANPIAMMEMEHSGAMVLLARLRELTEGYSCPEDACDGYRRAMKLMEEFEVDTHEHIRKENEVLFPKAIELEASTRG